MLTSTSLSLTIAKSDCFLETILDRELLHSSPASTTWCSDDGGYLSRHTGVVTCRCSRETKSQLFDRGRDARPDLDKTILRVRIGERTGVVPCPDLRSRDDATIRVDVHADRQPAMGLLRSVEPQFVPVTTDRILDAADRRADRHWSALRRPQERAPVELVHEALGDLGAGRHGTVLPGSAIPARPRRLVALLARSSQRSKVARSVHASMRASSSLFGVSCRPASTRCRKARVAVS